MLLQLKAAGAKLDFPCNCSWMLWYWVPKPGTVLLVLTMPPLLVTWYYGGGGGSSLTEKQR